MAEDLDIRFQPLLNNAEDQDDEYTYRPERRKRRSRGWSVALIIVLLLALAGGGFYYWQSNKTVPVQYTTATVSTGNISTTISATGPISANATYPLNFAQPGQVSALDVKIGQSVTAGQVLAEIYVNGNTSKVAELTAPEAATVASINGVVGQSATSGGGSSSGSSAFMTLVDLSKMNIVAQVNETDLANVQVGQYAQFTVASYPSATFRATASSIELIGQTSSNVVTFPVHLSVDLNSIPHGDHLYPGMTATVDITTAQRIGTVLVPASAISFTSTALQNGEVSRSAITSLNQGTTGGSVSSTQSSGSSRVVLTLNNGTLTPVLIKSGLSNGQYYEVLSGLQAGQQVVVSQTGGTTSTSSSTSTRTTRTGGSGYGGGGGGGGTRQGG